VVGRARLLAEAEEQLRSGGSVLLSGPAGIGKSTVINLLADRATAAGALVLRCCPAVAEAQLPFLALIDLLEPVAERLCPTLPELQRDALESALLRRPAPLGDRDGLALRLAVTTVLRTLATDQQVLMVIDDAQWTDEPSAELLAFVTRRLVGLPVHALVSERVEVGESPTMAVALCPPPVRDVPVSPLSTAEVAELLARHFGAPFPPSTAQRVHMASGGNPHYALELGRALRDRSTPLGQDEPLPVPARLRAQVLVGVDELSAPVRETLTLASAGAKLTVDALVQAGRENAAAELDAAAQAGVLRPVGVGEATVRFAHPLMAAALYAQASDEQRRAAHHALVDSVSDPVERARHLALATADKDPQVAEALRAAAEQARAAGTPALAARLGVLAAGHLPAGDVDALVECRLVAAEDAVAAGQFDVAKAVADQALEVAREPGQRMRAWIAMLDSCGQALADLDDVFAQASLDAGDDPELLAKLDYRRAWRHVIVEGDSERARDLAQQTAERAARIGDRATEVFALTHEAMMRLRLGDPTVEDTLSRALAAPEVPRVSNEHNGPRYVKARLDEISDRVPQARAELAALAVAAEERGAVESLMHLLRGIAELDIRAGRCEQALEGAYRALNLAEDAGMSTGPALRVASLAEAAGGRLDRARELAERGLRSTEDEGDLLHLPRNLHALGHALLLSGEAQAAAEALRRVRQLEREQRIAEPGITRAQADLAEALIAIGELDEAAQVITDGRTQAIRLGRWGILATLDRATAMSHVARRELDVAASLLRSAASRFLDLGYPLEEARTRLALGRVEIRRHRPAVAETELRQALRICRRTKAQPWLALVNEELDGLGSNAVGVPGAGVNAGVGAGGVSGPLPTGAAPAPPPVVLTRVERQVTKLVASGATNREISRSLYVSVKTVEATLTRIYRKLGIRSRVDLARLFNQFEESAAHGHAELPHQGRAG
jgi:DNA-binding CsgD family transcriptional regulator/tetratricopeptide (TPR) repeat protein